MKPTLTLVIGLPGVGKSTVAKMLAEKEKGVVLNSDVIRRELFSQKRDYSPQETQHVIAETRERVETLLKSGTSVILDALFTKKRAREEYRKFAEKIGVNFRVLQVNADEANVKEWMEKRQKEGDVSEADFAYHLDRKKYFESEDGGIIIENSGDLSDLRNSLFKV